METGIPFAFNEDCYIVIGPNDTIKVRKATVRKIICTIAPSNLHHGETNCEKSILYTCKWRNGRGSEHTAVVKEGFIFKSHQDALIRAKRFVTERFEKAMDALEVC